MIEIADHSTAGAEAAAQPAGRDASTNSTARKRGQSPELRDLRALAESTKKRISQRMSTQADAQGEPLMRSSSLALRTISLPAPGRDRRGGDEGEAQPVEPRRRMNLPPWASAAISAAIAAAIVAFALPNPVPDASVVEPAPPATIEAASKTAGPLASSVSTPRSAPRQVHADGTMTAHQDDSAEPVAPIDQAAVTPGAGAAQEEPARPARAESKAARRAMSRAAEAAARRATRAPAAGEPDSARAEAPEDEEARAQTRDDAAATDGEPASTAAEADPIDALLSAASGGQAGPSGPEDQAAVKNTEETTPRRTELDRGDVQKAMKPIHGKAQACAAGLEVPGTVMIRFAVKPDGSISSARAIGEFKGTDTGDCVARAVQSARLPAYDGAPMTFTYPFLLTQ